MILDDFDDVLVDSLGSAKINDAAAAVVTWLNTPPEDVGWMDEAEFEDLKGKIQAAINEENVKAIIRCLLRIRQLIGLKGLLLP